MYVTLLWAAAIVAVSMRSVFALEHFNDVDYAEAAFFTSIDSGNCTHNVRLLWQTEVGASLFAPPALVDVFSDGRKEIIAPTFTHYLEVLDGLTGNDVQGWPYAHPKFSSQTTPLRFDVQRDGTPEIMISTFDGDIVFFTEDGEPLPEMTIGLDARVVNFKDPAAFPAPAPKPSSPTTTTTAAPKDKIIGDALMQERLRHAARAKEDAPARPKQTAEDPALVKKMAPTTNQSGPSTTAAPAVPPTQAPNTGKKLLQIALDNDAPVPLGDAGQQYGGNAEYYGEDPDEYYGYDSEHRAGGDVEITHAIGADGALSPEARASMDLVFHTELFEGAELAVKLDGSDPFVNIARRPSRPALPFGSVYMDPHILASPAIADIDADGQPDLVIPVSYFLHRGGHDVDDMILKGLPDPADYVTSSLVAFDLVTKRVKWSHDFPVTLRDASNAGFLLGMPTVVSLDSRNFEIIIATGSGELHVFDGNGREKKGFPITSLGSIPSQALVDDVNADGAIDICIAGTAGVVSCIDPRTARPLWQFNVQSAVADGVVAGDVNGDAYLDVVVTTVGGYIYALDGRTGKPLAGFPVRGAAGFVASALLLNMNNTDPPMSPESGTGLHIIAPGLDGRLYVVSGTNGCVEFIDIAHKVYAQVLADDMTGNGRMDLVVATLSGSILVLATDAPYHPLKPWPSKPMAMNGLTARWGYLGIYVEPQSRVSRDVSGEFFRMLVTVVDHRPALMQGRTPPLYYVTVTIGTGLLVLSKLYSYPGTHLEIVPTPAEAVFGTVTVTMQISTGQRFDDRFALSFNMHFLEAVKYVVLIPFLACMGALLLVRKHHTSTPIDDELFMTTTRTASGRRQRRFIMDPDDTEALLIYYELQRNRDRSAPTRPAPRPRPSPATTATAPSDEARRVSDTERQMQSV